MPPHAQYDGGGIVLPLRVITKKTTSEEMGLVYNTISLYKNYRKKRNYRISLIRRTATCNQCCPELTRVIHMYRPLITRQRTCLNPTQRLLTHSLLVIC